MIKLNLLYNYFYFYIIFIYEYENDINNIMKNELSVFVPSHITGVFEIIQNSNPLLKGSKGAGITLDESVVTNTKIKDGNGNIIINVNNKEDSLNTISKRLLRLF